MAVADPNQNLVALEERVRERWRERDVFHESLRRRADAPQWVFYEGPPTANGRPGSHHVLARVFKDIYPRYRTMRGFRVDRKGGWDCHGLPVEIAVEQKLGLKTKGEIETLGIAEFNRLCRESVFEYLEDWNALTERIGFWLDLEDAYRTLDDSYIESVWWALRRIYDKACSTSHTGWCPTARATRPRCRRTRSHWATATSSTPASTCASPSSIATSHCSCGRRRRGHWCRTPPSRLTPISSTCAPASTVR